MSCESSSDTSQNCPGRSSNYFDRDRYRSRSWQPAVQHYDLREDSPVTRSGVETCVKRNVPCMEQTYRQVLGDNLRLWESVNILRCNPRLLAMDVVRQLYSMTDNEFFERYPTYRDFKTCGHGGLDSTDEGGGRKYPEKRAAYLDEHTKGLLRENTRLIFCLDILNHQPGRSADEVVSHCFSMSDTDFIRHHPTAEGGSRLRASLARMRSREQARHRSHSLPTTGQLPTTCPQTRHNIAATTGPSCSNNNEVFVERHYVRAKSPSPTCVDPLYTSSQRVVHARQETLSPNLDPAPIDPTSVSGRGLLEQQASTTPVSRRHVVETPSRARNPHKPSKLTSRQSRKETEKKRTPSTGKTQVPYMLSLHPYNWATSNNSSLRPSVSYSRKKELRQSNFQPEDNEENAPVYRKHLDAARLSGTSLSADRKPSSLNHRTKGPKISFSSSPVALTKRSDDTKNCQHEAVRGSSYFTYSNNLGDSKPCNLPLPLQRKAEKIRSPTIDMGSKGSIARRPRTVRYEQQSQSAPMPPYSDLRQPITDCEPVEKSVIFQHSQALPTKYDTDISDPNCRHYDFTPTPRMSHLNKSKEKPKPLYYKARYKDVSDTDVSEDEDNVFPQRCARYRIRSNHRRLMLPPKDDTLPAMARRRLSGSGSPSQYVNDDLPRQLHDDLSSSRQELMEFRNTYHQQSQTDSSSKFSLEKSPMRSGFNDTSKSPYTEVSRDIEGSIFKDRLSRKNGNSYDRDSTIPTSYQSNSPRASALDELSYITHSVKPNSTSATEFSTHKRQTNDASQKKTYRSPNYRRLHLPPEKKSKRHKRSARTQTPPTLIPYSTFGNENGNRIPMPSSERSVPSGKYGTQMGFLKCLVTADCDSVTERLLQEKRELDQKHLRHQTRTLTRRCLSEPPPCSWTKTSQQRHNSNLYRGYFPYRATTRNRFPEGYPGTDILYDTPRIWKKAADVVQSEFSDGELERSRPGADINLVERDNLLNETDRCRLCSRDGLRQDRNYHDAFTRIYSNLGVPLEQDMNRTTGGNAHRNTNCNHCTQHLVNDCCWPDTSDGQGAEEDDRQEESGGGERYSKDTEDRLNDLTKKAEDTLRATHDAPGTLLGEVAYQLECRIISQVFTDVRSSSDSADNKKDNGDGNDKRHGFYGYMVLNLPQKIRCECRDHTTGKRNDRRQVVLMRRFQNVIAFLRDRFGYHIHKHARLCQKLIQKHGFFTSPPDAATVARLDLHNFRSLRNHLIRLSEPRDRPEILILLDCLQALSQRDHKPVLWFG